MGRVSAARLRALPGQGPGPRFGAHALLRAAGVGVAAVAGYWVLESAVHAFVLHRGTFAEALRPSSGNELWMRGLIAALLLLVSALVFLRPAPRPPEDVALLGRVVEAASEGVLITDALGRIQYVNPAFTRITGYALAEVVGRTPAVLKSGAMDPAFYRGLWDTIRAGQVWVGTLTDRRRDGRFYPAVLTIVPVLDPQGQVRHYVGIQRDESDRTALSARADEAEKLAQVGRLVGGVAHDFNNTLTTLNALSDLASREARGNADLQALLSGIDVAVDGAGALVRQLLDFLREDHPELPVGRLDLVAFARRVRPALEALVPEAVAFEYVPPPPGTVARADAHGLQHLLANLLLNAVDAVADQAAPRIRLRFGAGFEGGVGSRDLAIQVRDNGPGIPEARRESIFEPFFTTKGKGTGLGLPSARETVRRFGGELVLEHTGPEGTTFTVRLPVG